MRGYAGSIAMTAGGLIAATSPKGAVVMLHAADGAHLATHARADICGVAPSGPAFLLTDGSGAMWSGDAGGLKLLSQGGPAWNNHLVTLS